MTAHTPPSSNVELNTPSGASLLALLAKLGQSGAEHMAATGVALERCRLAAEWKQTVQEQGTLLTGQIRLQMAELSAQLKHSDAGSWNTLLQPLGLEGVTNAEQFEMHRQALVRDLNVLVQAHMALDDCMVHMASMLVEVEAHSEVIISSSERIRLNGLVASS